jgi:hypothetical protein
MCSSSGSRNDGQSVRRLPPLIDPVRHGTPTACTAAEFQTVDVSHRIRSGVESIRLVACWETGDYVERLLCMPVQEIKASSAIERVGYDPAGRNLSVWFKGGRRYVYADVPPELYLDLCSASSAGRFINSAVKGRFPCRSERPRRLYSDRADD